MTTKKRKALTVELKGVVKSLHHVEADCALCDKHSKFVVLTSAGVLCSKCYERCSKK